MTSNVFSCTEAARCYPFVANAPSHDAFTRCLQRQPPDTEALLDEVKNHVKLEEGFLIVDDSTLDEPYAKEMAFVRRMWSGKHHRTVKGIGLVTLVWTDGTTVIPIDFRIYNIDEDDKTKNDHFRDMLDKAEERGFNPEFVLFDTWYSSVKNLKAIRKKEWHFLTRLKKNRLVNPDKKKNVPLETVDIPHKGLVVHLKTYGFVKVFRIVSKDGDTQHWVTDVYHRGIKQFCGVEKCQARKEESQRAHIMFSLRAFLRLELQRIKTGISWFESTMKIRREAVTAYLNNPLYTLN